MAAVRARSRGDVAGAYSGLAPGRDLIATHGQNDPGHPPVRLSPPFAMKMMTRRLKTVAILTLLGTPSYVLCFGWHICMAGHMQHPPYPLYQWISDVWWMGCFAAVVVFSLRLQAKRKRWFFYGSLFLLVSRIPLGGLGGGNIMFKIPVLIVMDVFAVKYLVRPNAYVNTGRAASSTEAVGGGSTTHPTPSVRLIDGLAPIYYRLIRKIGSRRSW